MYIHIYRAKSRRKKTYGFLHMDIFCVFFVVEAYFFTAYFLQTFKGTRHKGDSFNNGHRKDFSVPSGRCLER